MALKITEYLKGTNEKRIIYLMPAKDGSDWQYINLSKGHICPCKFESRAAALEDFKRYTYKFDRVVIEELDAL